jgi:DNA-binding GntR family transcriptional regulator
MDPPISLPLAQLAPTRKRGLAEDVAQRLREAIVRGYFAPGQALREEQLAATLEVSRGPVREAFTQLEREGLVLVRPHRGATVARLSRTDVEEVYSLRLALERLAVQYFVRHAQPEDFSALQAVIQEMGKAWSRGITEQEAAELDIRFHDLMYRAARHERLYNCWSNLKSQIYVFLLTRNVANPDFREQAVKSHSEILDALAARDPKLAGQRIEEHLRAAYVRVMSSYVEKDGDQNEPLSLAPIAEFTPRRTRVRAPTLKTSRSRKR